MPIPRKLTKEQIELIWRKYHEHKVGCTRIGHEFNVSKWTIQRIINRQTYQEFTEQLTDLDNT